MRPVAPLLLLAVLGCGCHPVPDTPQPEPPGDPDRSVISPQDIITVCLISGNEVDAVSLPFRVQDGDTLVDAPTGSQHFRHTPPPYGDSLEWFKNREAISFQQRGYFWNGPALVLDPAELREVGKKGEVALYAERDSKHIPNTILVPIEPGCKFQPFYHFRGY